MLKREFLLVLAILCCMFSNTVFAEIGPLTAKYQEMIRDSGAVFIKCNAYSLYDVNYGNTKQRMKPTVLKEIAINTKDIYCYEISRNLYSVDNTQSLTLAKGNKIYTLDLDSKTGKYYNVQLHGNASAVSVTGGNNLVPSALIYILPKSFRNLQMQGLPFMYRYKKAYDVKVDDITYRCEEYSNFYSKDTDSNGKKKLYKMPNIVNLDRIYRLYFLEGKLVKYAHGDRIADVIEVSTNFDNKVFDIPKGFTIVEHEQKIERNVNKGMDDLLQKNNVNIVERY